MRRRILVPLLVLSFDAVAAQNSLDLVSCDVRGQREVAGETGGQISDPRQAHISVRANVLTADIGTARKARKITQAEAESLFERVDGVRHQTNSYVEQQGFLSAAETASFDREFDAITKRLCK